MPDPETGEPINVKHDPAIAGGSGASASWT
jgi:hypothetical protein